MSGTEACDTESSEPDKKEAARSGRLLIFIVKRTKKLRLAPVLRRVGTATGETGAAIVVAPVARRIVAGGNDSTGRGLGGGSRVVMMVRHMHVVVVRGGLRARD
jgi:hypothetical protein